MDKGDSLALHEESPKAEDKYGDASDGQINWNYRQIIALFSLSALWVGSQIPLYFVGGMLSYMTEEIGGTAGQVWLPVCNTLVLAAVGPFAGYLQDLFGRRVITLCGSLAVMVGIALVGSAHSFAQGVAGMSLAGGGAAIGELTALAGTSELVPVRLRGLYVGLIVCFIIPFCPYVLYSQLLSVHATWRWCMWISLIYNGVAFLGIFLFYFPEKHHQGLTIPKVEILKKIDFVGALLSIAGATLFLVGLQAGGYDVPWASARALSPLIIGIVLILFFVGWEWKIAKRPIIPREIFSDQRAVGVSFFVAFVGGMNFYSLLNFYPMTFSAVYTPTPVAVGLKGLGYGFSVTLGAIFFNFMLSVFKNHNREVLFTAAVIMTAFGGAVAAVTPENPGFAVAMGTISGFGVGGILVPTQTIAVMCSPDEFIATTVALSLSIRVIGGSIGYAIYYNIFVTKLTANLPVYVAKYALGAGLPVSSAETFVATFLTTPANITGVAGVNEVIIAAATKGTQWAYAESLKYVWYTSIPFGVCAIIACAFIGSTEKFMTNRIAAHIKVRGENALGAVKEPQD